MQQFEYHRPGSVQEAVDLLAEHGDRVRVLAGGTDLIVALRHRTIEVSAVLDVKGITDLPSGIEHSADAVTVGATATYQDLLDDPETVSTFPALADAMQVVGSVQIRNRGTLVGNSCHASPAADTVPGLLVHDAVVLAVGAAGVREIPIDDFILGPRRTALQPGELAAAIRIPKPSAATGTAFARMTRRRGVDLATINLHCSVDADGRVRFAFGAVGPRAFLAEDRSGILADPTSSEVARREAVEQVLQAASPISDVRASDRYRWGMLRVLSLRALAQAHARLQGAAPATEER